MVVFPAGGGECSSDLKHEAMNGREDDAKYIERLPLLSLSDGKPQVEVRGWVGALLSNVMKADIEFIVNLEFHNFPMMTEIFTNNVNCSTVGYHCFESITSFSFIVTRKTTSKHGLQTFMLILHANIMLIRFRILVRLKV